MIADERNSGALALGIISLAVAMRTMITDDGEGMSLSLFESLDKSLEQILDRAVALHAAIAQGKLRFDTKNE